MLFSFPSIGQFYQFVSKNKSRPIDKVTFIGSVKLHGCNSAIGYCERDGLWFQSHKKIITPEADNYKFAATMKEKSDPIRSLMYSISEKYSISLAKYSIIVYGEFCGGNIQKNVAITGLPVMFVIFDIAYIPIDYRPEELKWLDIQKFPIPEELQKLVYNILDFPTYTLEVDFSNLAEIRDRLIKLTEEVERECPVGKYFGKSGTGEGIVWRASLKIGDKVEVHRFKVKGDEHSTSKVTTMAAIDVEKAKTLEDFVNKTVTENRLKQGIAEIFGDETQSQTWFQRIGKFNQWVVHDVKKEDMAAFPLDFKENEKALNRAITDKSTRWFRHYVEMGAY